MPAVLFTSLFACTIPRKYQPGKPFVFATNIKVEGNLKPAEKQDLSTRLANQLDDSLRTQVVAHAGLWKTIVNPPVFDTNNVRRSLAYMVALLNASGYYSPTISDSIIRDTIRSKNRLRIDFHKGYPRFLHHRTDAQYRVTVNFRVSPGKQLKLDSIVHALQTPALQALVLQNKAQSLLKKGAPYSKNLMIAELDRLVDLFQNNGYYKFSREDLLVERDTVVAALIDPTLDPFQQAALLAELKRKREHPTINVEIRQRPVTDSADITQFYINHVTVYPDLLIQEDTTTIFPSIDTTAANKFTVISRANKFKPSFITSNIYLRPGRLYKQSNYNRTINRFNQMGAWSQAAINLIPSDSADTLLDVYLRLYPAKKQNLNVSLETTRNTYDIVTSSNLFGVGVNLGLRNRNTFRQSVLSSTNLRGGVELGASFIQTTQASISHSISFPRLIAPFALKREYRLDSIRTVLDFNAAYTDRREFFTLRSFNTSWGYQWTKGNRSFLYRPLNIEYMKVDGSDSLKRIEDSIPSLKLAFKTGLVVGQQFVYNSVKKSGIHTNFLRISAEESGATLGLIKSVNEGDLWRFIKGDIEYRRHIDYRRSQIAMRLYAGAGWAYGKEGIGGEETLPFYKAFFAGGPNSMRGWQVRQLGLGSSKIYTQQGNPDRFGDVQLEGNIEYRFPLGSVFGVKLLSGVYVDAGNIWDRHLVDTTAAAVGSDFKFNRFYKEFAFDAGTGLRLDFDYFLIRFDWAYKIRDPQRLENSAKWFYGLNLGSGQFQLGIGYPF